MNNISNAKNNKTTAEIRYSLLVSANNLFAQTLDDG